MATFKVLETRFGKWKNEMYKWKMGDVSQCIRDAECNRSIVSNFFSLSSKDGAKFMMKLLCDNTYSNIHLVCTEFGQNKEIKLSTKSWFENSEGTIEGIQGSQGRELTFTQSRSSHWLTHQETPALKEFAKGNMVFVCIELQYKVPSNDESDIGYDKNELTDRSEFSQKMLELHSDGQFDLTIQVEDKEFKTSKLVLMSHSDVFRRMLLCPNSIEAQTGIVKMENTKPNVIEAMLKWIYQTEIDNMDEVASDLYRTADKYDIGLLKKNCVNVMITRLSKDNFLSSLILAYKFSEENLKKRVINFISEDNKRLKSLMASDEWAEFSSNDPELRKKIVEDIFG